MALVKRKLRATVTLASSPQGGQQTFQGTGGANTVTIENLRMSARLSHAGGPSDGMMGLTVYGLKLSTMNQLSTLGMQINLIPKNAIVLEAGEDDGNGGIANASTVFVGYILAAYGDFNAMPNVAFHITAQCGLPLSVIPAQASSYKGSVDVATIMSSLATQMGLKFENSGVQTKLSNQYLSGSYRTQAQSCAVAAGISWTIEKGILAIWPKNGSRNGQIPLVSKSTGMKGSPTYTAYGIAIETLYNPSIGFGGKIKVESFLPAACGEWAVYSLDHALDCELPDGAWFSTVLAYNPKFSTPVV